jgi:hypothetical protein
VHETANRRDVTVDDGRERRGRRVGRDHDRLCSGRDPDEDEEHPEHEEQQHGLSDTRLGTKHPGRDLSRRVWASLGRRMERSYRTKVRGPGALVRTSRHEPAAVIAAERSKVAASLTYLRPCARLVGAVIDALWRRDEPGVVVDV